MNKTYTTISEFAEIVAKISIKNNAQNDTKQIVKHLRIIRTLLNKSGVDIFKIVGSTPKEVFIGNAADSLQDSIER